MQEHCDLKVCVNGEHTFHVNQRIVSTFSGRMRELVREEEQTGALTDSVIELDEFPGGPYGFELVIRFCYNNGRFPINLTNACLLHCCAVYLEMTEEISSCNLLQRTEAFLQGLSCWTWNDVLTALKSCELFLPHAESSSLLQKLIFSLLVKISENSDITVTTSSSSSSSSPEANTIFRVSSSRKTPDSAKGSPTKAWWFDGLTILPPRIIEKVMKTMGAYGTENNSLLVTRFLLQYLKRIVQKPRTVTSRNEYGGLADTAVHGVISMGETAFSCRALFWVLRVVSGFGLSRESRTQLERLIGGMLDQATLDDLLVTGHDGAIYDVNLILRLLRVFANEQDNMSLQRMKKVGRLIDKYMREISPDPSLKISKFLAVAESLPDFARDCVDGVYRAIDIYLESHPSLSSEERSRLCRCLNYEKLTLETCKDLAKNPRIPPRAAIQALASQQSKINPAMDDPLQAFHRRRGAGDQFLDDERERQPDEKEEMRMNLERMQSRVMELEEVCRQMKGRMSKMVKNKVISTPAYYRPMPRLC